MFAQLEDASGPSIVDLTPDVGGISRSMHLAEGRLAAARLAHEAERLAATHVEADAVHGLHGADLRNAEQAAADLEVLDEVLDLDERLGLALRAGRGVASGRPRPRSIGTVGGTGASGCGRRAERTRS